MVIFMKLYSMELSMQLFFEPVRNRKGAASLVDQAVEAIESAIRQRLLRPGMPVPSIRHFAKAHGLSTFTVSAPYRRLLAQKWLTASPVSGYQVARTVRNTQPKTPPPPCIPPPIEPPFLLAHRLAY